MSRSTIQSVTTKTSAVMALPLLSSGGILAKYSSLSLTSSVYFALMPVRLVNSMSDGCFEAFLGSTSMYSGQLDQFTESDPPLLLEPEPQAASIGPATTSAPPNPIPRRKVRRLSAPDPSELRLAVIRTPSHRLVQQRGWSMNTACL